MTGNLVSGLGNFNLLNYQTQTQPVEETGMADFKSFMDATGNNLKKLEVRAESKKVDESPKESTEISKTDSSREETKVSNEVETTKEPSDEEVKSVEDAVKKVADEISKVLDVTVEEIEAVLAEMGLNMLALLDTERIPEIVAKLSDLDSTMELAFNEDAYEALKNITDVVEEVTDGLFEELDIPKEEFSNALKANEEIVVAEESVEVTPFEEKISFRKTENHTFEGKVENIQTEDLQETESVPDADATFEDFHKESNPDNSAAYSFAEKLIEKTVEAFNESSETVSYSTATVTDIMNQITEAIKVDFSSEMNEISLRLHPETLGTVSVKISANHEGVLTAEFTAQNESVKAIIESQAVALKETLEAKGVTVEAVEVMVQSHEFERNLNEQNRGGKGASESKKRGIRRINLSEDAFEEENSDDSLVREMMAQNGNTIDYSA